MRLTPSKRGSSYYQVARAVEKAHVKARFGLPDTSPYLGIRLLGPVEVTSGGSPCPLPKLTHRILLAILVSAGGRVVSGSSLIEELWHEDSSLRRRKNLQTHVYQLRRELREIEPDRVTDRIITRPPGYQLTVEDCELDLHALDDLVTAAREAARHGDLAQAGLSYRQALALWRGPALADVHICTPALGRLADQLEEQRIAILEERIDVDLAAGLQADLIPELGGLIAAHPLRERLRARLMLSLYRSGRQADALLAYQDAREVLLEELGLDPSAELQDLHRRILNGDDIAVAGATAETDREGHTRGPASPMAAKIGRPLLAATVIPRQLPAAARHFTGRHTELGTLASLLEQSEPTAGAGGTAVISAIDGMAGVGKTALAVHAAHLLASRFPDGQLFIDLHGYTRGHQPHTPSEALDFFLRSLGVPVQDIPRDVQECAALYRQCLADSRILIVLDNALDEAQVRDLLPAGTGCLVLITSRRRLKGLDDAHTLALDVIAPSRATALFHAVAGLDHIQAADPILAEITDLCGYLPLAVRIAASLLRHRPAWSLVRLAELLRDQQQRISALADGERQLSATFDLSYESLGVDHQHLYRCLSLIPGPDTDTYAAAALAGAGPATVTRLLEDLVDHNLLIEQVPGRYRFHDLIRAHARTLAQADRAADRHAAIDRLLDYHQRTARDADPHRVLATSGARERHPRGHARPAGV
jgi:DNA-binding SARP family transcriptional activator